MKYYFIVLVDRAYINHELKGLAVHPHPPNPRKILTYQITENVPWNTPFHLGLLWKKFLDQHMTFDLCPTPAFKIKPRKPPHHAEPLGAWIFIHLFGYIVHVYITIFQTDISFNTSHIENCHSFCVVDSETLHFLIAITRDINNIYYIIFVSALTFDGLTLNGSNFAFYVYPKQTIYRYLILQRYLCCN